MLNSAASQDAPYRSCVLLCIGIAIAENRNVLPVREGFVEERVGGTNQHRWGNYQSA
jgi:hypothetical protein